MGLDIRTNISLTLVKEVDEMELDLDRVSRDRIVYVFFDVLNRCCLFIINILLLAMLHLT